MAQYIVVPIAQRARVRLALVQHLAGLIGRRVVNGAIEGEPSGRGPTTQVVPERVSRDGLFVAFDLERSDSQPLVLTHPRTRVQVVRPIDLAGTTVRGVTIPAAVERGPEFFPDPV